MGKEEDGMGERIMRHDEARRCGWGVVVVVVVVCRPRCGDGGGVGGRAAALPPVVGLELRLLVSADLDFVGATRRDATRVRPLSDFCPSTVVGWRGRLRPSGDVAF